MENAVLLKNLSKRFFSPYSPQETYLAVDQVSMELKEGEFLAMVGPRGCGKSTILRMIAGLEHVDRQR
jgi:ABC-type sugar transport system ATPase subunit